MQFPVQVEQVNGHYEVSLLGRPSVRAEAPSRIEALAKLRLQISQSLHSGDLVMLDVPMTPVVDFVGILEGDPTLAELRDEIYRNRAAEPYPEYE